MSLRKVGGKKHLPQLIMLFSTVLGISTSMTNAFASTNVGSDPAANKNTGQATDTTQQASATSDSSNATAKAPAIDESQPDTGATSSNTNGTTVQTRPVNVQVVSKNTDGEIVSNKAVQGFTGENLDIRKYLPTGYHLATSSQAKVVKLSAKPNQVVVAHVLGASQPEPMPVEVKSGTDKNVVKRSKKAPDDKTISKAVPVSAKLVTPLPTIKRASNEVHNPMLRPDNNADRISSAKDFKSEVPFRNGDEIKDMKNVRLYKDFDKSVLRWKPYLDKVTKHYKMTKYTDLFLAIMENETHGTKSDLMQSSESAGLKPNTLNPHQSIEQAVRYMKAIVKKAKAMDKAEKNNSKIKENQYHYYATDNRLLAQTYAFGGGFLDYVSRQKDGYTFKTAEMYSKTVVAPLLGNTTGETYKYSNPISKMYHKEYLYKNGGNFFYGDLVSQYLVTGFMRQIMQKMVKYVGQPYVFGGKNPQTGFDCSGFVSYGLQQVKASLPSYTVTQFHQTDPVKSIKDVKPGDLIFFKGTYGAPSFISHIEFMIDRHTMFGSNSSGVGFHSVDEGYWRKHFAGIHRVKDAKKLNKAAAKQMQHEVISAVDAFK